MKSAVFILAISTLITPAVFGGDGCCGSSAGAAPATSGGCTRDAKTMAVRSHQGCGGEQQTSATACAAKSTLPETVQSVFKAYFNVQTALAEDSMQKANAAAATLAKAVSSDTDDLLPAKVSEQVQALLKAQDLTASREAFKSLSDSLIAYLNDKSVSPGIYRVAYCGMAKASWLQVDSILNNPYMGKEMPHCGKFKT